MASSSAWNSVPAAGEAQDARRQLAALEAMTQTAGVIASMREGASGAAALDLVASAARKLLGLRMAAITVVEDGGERLIVVAHDGFEGRRGRTVFLPHEAPNLYRSVRQRRVVEVPDVEIDPEMNRAEAQAWGVRSALFAPLIVQEEVIGCLVLADDVPRTFGEGEKHLAHALGAQVGVILVNQRLIREKDAALEVQRRLATQREALYQISSEIYESENLHESLQRLADVAPGITGVDLCTVNLRAGRGEATEWEVVAITGNYGNCRGARWSAPPDAALHAGETLRTRKMRVVVDAARDGLVHPEFKHRLRIGSNIYVPLVVRNDQVIGLMVLIRHLPGTFSPEQLELASVLAARAASAIETARLHEAAVQSNRMHETLLRELHHRVKNNLASIVSLLSMNRPAMPEEARQWLDRATQRIATMARTHELFVGGRERVRVDELVNKLLPALSLVKPPAVEVRTDVDGGGAELELDTEQAVSLAIVLNELCWNGLEHGTGDRGVLEIRGRQRDGRVLMLEVEDQGRGEKEDEIAVAGAAEAERGTGLRLVEGLVSRELRGRFELRPKPQGGTVARVEIPLG